MEHALTCPQCNAPLTPHRFARSVVCSYCGTTVQLDEAAVSAEIFHRAFRAWNEPVSYGLSSWISIGDSHWQLDRLLAHGDSSDVYAGRRARWPTERVLVKLLRDSRDSAQFDNEWQSLQALHASDAQGADVFVALLPEPIVHGNLHGGEHAGQGASVFRWADGFKYTFEEVSRAYPSGIPPRASIWVWRRILEVLSFIHSSRMAHGAILPSHLMVQEHEHGVRLVGYGCAGRPGSSLRRVPDRYAAYYPAWLRKNPSLSVDADLAMSARCVIALLAGDPAEGLLPSSVPAQLSDILKRTALRQPSDRSGEDAWSLRERLGQIAHDVFGAPKFIPIDMPA